MPVWSAPLDLCQALQSIGLAAITTQLYNPTQCLPALSVACTYSDWVEHASALVVWIFEYKLLL